ncbi:MAG: DUF692 domain-containing protein [Psychrosphaera sp.]|nr:DUF692 domain-containing protein [Psychrosphaera sp.]
MFGSNKISGTGIGLRTPHIQQILTEQPDIPWLEILADNHLCTGGITPAHLHAIRERYPVTMHCVSMSLGATDPIDWDYMAQIKRVADTYDISWISDHICFTSAGNRHAHDLLPLPYTEEALANLVERTKQVQDFLNRRILLENATNYIEFSHSTLTEIEFVSELVKQADCDLLFDVNNVYVNQQNHGIDAANIIDQLPLERIKEIHLAGFDDRGDYMLDAHNNKVADPVWQLYKQLQQRKPGIATQIEWDNDLPDLATLMGEADKAQKIMNQCINDGEV